MTLHSRNPNAIEPAQANAVKSLGGSHLHGEFEYTINGWMVTFSGLAFSELVLIVEAARKAIRE